MASIIVNFGTVRFFHEFAYIYKKKMNGLYLEIKVHNDYIFLLH